MSDLRLPGFVRQFGFRSRTPKSQPLYKTWSKLLTGRSYLDHTRQIALAGFIRVPSGSFGLGSCAVTLASLSCLIWMCVAVICRIVQQALDALKPVKSDALATCCRSAVIGSSEPHVGLRLAAVWFGFNKTTYQTRIENPLKPPSCEPWSTSFRIKRSNAIAEMSMIHV